MTSIKNSDNLIKASAISKSIKHPFKKIIEKKYRPQLVMAIAILFFQQVTGINVISFYAPVIFRTIGFGESASLLSSEIGLGCLGIPPASSASWGGLLA
jgi:hypothetical protein